MKTVVTGGAGFIGSHIVDALVKRGDDVVVADDLSRGKAEQVNPAARLTVVDIRSAAFAQLIADTAPDVVFHLAAQMDVRRSVREPLLDTEINVLGIVNLLAACVAAKVRRVIFASSGGALYGDTDVLPTPEDHPVHPESVYGAAKYASELYGEVFTRMHGLEFVALRYGNVYGPRQDPHGEAGVVAIFAQQLLAGARASVTGDGKQTRDYVYIDDVVAANMAAIDCPAGAFNIGTSRAVDVNMIYTLIARACGVDTAADHGPARPGEQRRSCLAIGSAASALGWRPQITLEEGIPATVDFFRTAAVTV